MYIIKRSLSSPESALFLTELYDEEYNKATDTIEEKIFGPVLKRETENIEDFSMLGYHTKEYKLYDVKKFFGLTLVEYLDSTSFFKRTVIKEAKIAMEKLSRELNDVNERNKHTINELEEFNG